MCDPGLGQESLNSPGHVVGGSVWMGTRDRNIRGTQSEGPPHFCEFDLQELDKVLIVNIRENSPRASGSGRVK